MKIKKPEYLFAALSLAFVACLPRAIEHNNFPPPFNGEALVGQNSGDALVSYLRQRDADPAVCRADAAGAHVSLRTSDDIDDLIEGVGRGVRLDKWHECVMGMIPGLDPQLSSWLLDQVLSRYIERVAYQNLETDPEIQQQLLALRRIYEERPTGINSTPEGSQNAVVRLRQILDEQELGPMAREQLDAAIAVLAIEQGLTPDGQPVTVAEFDRLLERGEETPLIMLSRRVPDAALREQAARRLVRLRIRISPFAELRANAGDIEEMVIGTGRNAIPQDTAISQVAVVTESIPFRGIAVVQDVGAQTSHIYSFANPTDSNFSITPVFDFRAILRFTADGFSHPLTICAGPDSFDPNPCIDPLRVSAGVPWLTMQNDGHGRVAETIPAADALALSEVGGRFEIPITLDTRPVASLSLDLQYRTTGPLRLQPSYGQPGPRVTLDIDAISNPRLIFRANVGGQTYVAVIERDRLAEFGVIAAGGDGMPGAPGHPGENGYNGTSGNSASCPSRPATNGTPGGNGGPAGNGGPGGDGGPGGLISATLRCSGPTCAQVQGGLRLAAPGGAYGPGGAAGRGGAGGAGGRGGSSASCNGYTLPRGADAPNGMDGPDGMPGPDGRPGRDGRVEVSVRSR